MALISSNPCKRAFGCPKIRAGNGAERASHAPSTHCYRGCSKLRTHTALGPYGSSMPRSIGPSSGRCVSLISSNPFTRTSHHDVHLSGGPTKMSDYWACVARKERRAETPNISAPRVRGKVSKSRQGGGAFSQSRLARRARLRFVPRLDKE